MWGKGKRFGFVKISDQKVYWYARVNEKSFGRSLEIAEIFNDFDPLVLQLNEATANENIICNTISDLAPIPK
ncbi:hypothetical protein SAMN06265171_10435 [Chryseobacterium rhizoplanae]|uniref:Uncharacterized protein n=1 Tax=Chryseobacterium rhizoplanae TaxID=1609531 RepID=A0A521D203_9FLAO|nr:hypothetical protein [Chryseobacterium rhizoplanae]SMO64930.1 hypothetical protein SAMN06265171_10435 [Chryseobacterium rhizoplanae]